MTTIFALTAVFSLFLGGALAWLHPLWPAAVLATFYIWCVVAAWQPRTWLFAVPACLPFLNFSPWTGWLMVDEFDLLLLGTLAGGYARLVWQAVQTAMPLPSPERAAPGLRILILLLVGFTTVSLARGLAAAAGFESPLNHGYTDPMNTLRVAKSTVFAVLLWPLLRHNMATPAAKAQASQWLGTGMAMGLAAVTLAVLRERVAYPGLVDFDSRYRTTALFWEMHVGGGAIDAYLALAAPFVAWALWMARRPLLWVPCALLAVLTCYACLTTFSRGVYLAVGLPLLVFSIGAGLRHAGLEPGRLANAIWARMRPTGWRRTAGWVLGLALVTEVVGVMTGGSFMRDRLNDTDKDFASRFDHWARGISLLEAPADWLAGVGLGRLPAEYAAIGPDTELSGTVRLVASEAAALAQAPRTSPPNAPAHPYLRLTGPATDADLGGLYSLTQQVDLMPGGTYRVALNQRVAHDTDVLMSVCEKHLLYDGHCQYRQVKIHPTPAGWQRVTIPLSGAPFPTDPGWLPRSGVFSISVASARTPLDLRDVHLTGQRKKEAPREFLSNGDFSRGLAHWFPTARHYYLPWHIDNLYLELLIERGLAGLLLGVALMVYALKRLTFPGRTAPTAHAVVTTAPVLGTHLAPYLAASLCGALLVGAVSSLMDVPRVAFLLQFLLFFSLQLMTDPPNG